MVCLCPLRLAIMPNFNISKVAYLKETPSPGKQGQAADEISAKPQFSTSQAL